MRIEEEIQQSSFIDEYHKGLVNLLFTHSFIVNKLNKVLKKQGITRQQYNVLRILRGNKPNSYNIGDIKARMIDKMSDVSRIIDRLEKKKLVCKSLNKQDKRITEIIISEQGTALLDKADPNIDHLDGNFRNLSTEEIQSLNALLDKIRK